MNRAKCCKDGCLVGFARGSHKACHSECAYMPEQKPAMTQDAPKLPDEPKQWELICKALPAEFIDYANSLRTLASIAIEENVRLREEVERLNSQMQSLKDTVEAYPVVGGKLSDEYTLLTRHYQFELNRANAAETSAAALGKTFSQWLIERREWLHSEAMNGGDWKHMTAREDECAYIRAKFDAAIVAQK